MIKKKKSVVALAVALVLVLALVTRSEAQQPKKVPRIGYLRFIENPVLDETFRKGLQELSYAEGRNIRVEYRYAGWSLERLAELAAGESQG